MFAPGSRRASARGETVPNPLTWSCSKIAGYGRSVLHHELQHLNIVVARSRMLRSIFSLSLPLVASWLSVPKVGSDRRCLTNWRLILIWYFAISAWMASLCARNLSFVSVVRASLSSNMAATVASSQASENVGTRSRDWEVWISAISDCQRGSNSAFRVRSLWSFALFTLFSFSSSISASSFGRMAFQTGPKY